jgi:hypothetical protein
MLPSAWTSAKRALVLHRGMSHKCQMQTFRCISTKLHRGACTANATARKELICECN